MSCGGGIYHLFVLLWMLSLIFWIVLHKFKICVPQWAQNIPGCFVIVFSLFVNNPKCSVLQQNFISSPQSVFRLTVGSTHLLSDIKFNIFSACCLGRNKRAVVGLKCIYILFCVFSFNLVELWTVSFLLLRTEWLLYMK